MAVVPLPVRVSQTTVFLPQRRWGDGRQVHICTPCATSTCARGFLCFLYNRKSSPELPALR